MKISRKIFLSLYKKDFYRKGIPNIKKSFGELKNYFHTK